MKKLIGFFICIFVLNACDDGDMTFDTFDFSEVNSSDCENNNLVFKINGNEALILQITEAFPFRNVLGEREYAVNASNKVFYRTFSADVTTAYFCSTIPPISPTVTEEWSTPSVSSGKIKITTTLVPGSTTMAGAEYNHTIILEDITFTNAQGQTLIYNSLPFGVYKTDSNVKFLFGTTPVQQCSTGKLFRVFDTNVGNESTRENLNEIIEINIPFEFLPTTDETKPIFLNESLGIRAVYKIYNGDVNADAYCSSNPALNLYESWKAEDGVDLVLDEDDKGYFLVTRSTLNSVSTYQITLNILKFNRVSPVADEGTAIGSFPVSTANFGNYILP